MNIKFNLKKFIIYSFLVFIINVAVQYLWILFFQESEVSFGLAATTAITISIALILLMPDK